MHTYIRFDGGSYSTCKGEAKHRPASYGFLLHTPSECYAVGDILPPSCTNNQAEFTGLIEGLKALKAAGAKTATVYGDSQFVIKTMTGEYKIKVAALKELLVEARKAAEGMDIVYVWQKRSSNSIADGMCRKAVEAGGMVREYFTPKDMMKNS